MVRAVQVLPIEVVDKDKMLALVVGEGERAHIELGKLRYEWCVKKGWTFTAYATAVGVDESTVRESVDRYAARKQLPLVGSFGGPPKLPTKAQQQKKSTGVGRGVGGGRPRTAEPVTRSERRQAAKRPTKASEGIAALGDRFMTEEARVKVEPNQGYACGISSIPAKMSTRTLASALRALRNEAIQIQRDIRSGRWDEPIREDTAIVFGMIFRLKTLFEEMETDMEGRNQSVD